MQLDRPWAKFCLKSDSNCLLMDFLDPISAARSIYLLRRYDTNSDTKFDSEFEFDQKYIEFDQKWLKTTRFSIKFEIFD